MKQLARGILRAIVSDLPTHKREYGQAMLAELEETHGLQTLEWTAGGIQLWAQTRGGTIMKNAAFWFGLVAIGILAGGLYVTQGLIYAVPVAAIGVIAFAAFRPRDALPVALLLGLSLPVADLLKVWIAVRGITSVTNYGSLRISGNSSNQVIAAFDPPTSQAMVFVSTAESKLNALNNDGGMTLSGVLPISQFGNKDVFLAIPSSFPVVAAENLPQLTIAVLLSAIIIAGIAAFVRSRVTARAQT